MGLYCTYNKNTGDILSISRTSSQHVQHHNLQTSCNNAADQLVHGLISNLTADMLNIEIMELHRKARIKKVNDNGSVEIELVRRN